MIVTDMWTGWRNIFCGNLGVRVTLSGSASLRKYPLDNFAASKGIGGSRSLLWPGLRSAGAQFKIQDQSWSYGHLRGSYDTRLQRWICKLLMFLWFNHR